MTTLNTLIDDITEYLQLSSFSGVSRRQITKWVNKAYQELFPKLYTIYNIKKEITQPTPVDFAIALPMEAKTVVEVVLQPPGMANPYEKLERAIRLTAYEIQTNHENRLELKFQTSGWYGTLMVTGEGCVTMSLDEPSKVCNVPSDEPVVHRVASYYYNMLANTALRDGDTQRYQAITNAAGRELQLSEFAANRVKMPRQIPRTGESIDTLRRGAAAKYSLTQNLPVK